MELHTRHETKTILKAYGLKVPLSTHRGIRKLEKDYRPTDHGYKVWDAGWLLVDYLKQADGISGKYVLDLGCGWGLSGIYCAKYLDASVTCVDIDDQVYPYLQFIRN